MFKLTKLLPIISVLIVIVLNSILIVSTHLSWNNSMQKYLPLQIQISNLETDISKAHLWFEEAISGDPYVDIQKDVMLPLQHRAFYLYIDSIETTFNSTVDRYYLNHLHNLEHKLLIFYATANKRWSKSKNSGIGSDSDQKFDSEFNNIISSIEALKLQLKHTIENEIADRNHIFYWMLSIFLFINIALLGMLLFAKREQEHYEYSLFAAKEQAIVTLQSIGDAVITTDTSGNITFLNEIAENLTEYNNNEVNGLHIDTILNLRNLNSGKKIITPIHDVLYGKLTKLISNGTILISKTGKEYIISDSAAPVKNKNGDILGAVLVFQDDTDKHKLDQQLQQTHELNKKLKERMELALLGSKDGVWDWNILDNSVYLSPRWKEMLGYTDNELSNHFSSWEDRIHPDDKELTLAIVQDNVDGKTEYYEGVHRLKHKDGHWVWILDRGKTVFDEKGKAIRMIGTHTDISQEKETQITAIERGKILDNSVNEIYIFDARSYKFLYINKGAENNIGYTLEEMLELTPFDIKADINRKDFLHLLRPIIEEDKESIFFSTLHQRKDGTKYDADTYLQSTIYEGHNAYVAIILDVTKRKTIEQDLANQYKLIHHIIDTVPVRIFWKDIEGRYIGANKLFLKDFQLQSINELIGKSDFELPLEKAEAQLHRNDDLEVMHSGKAKLHFEQIQTNAKGEVTILSTSKLPLKNSHGDTIGVLGSYADITQQRKMENELVKQKDILHHQAHHDALTGLPNRLLFNDRLEQAIEKAERNNTKVALFFIDLDHFKEINDSLGHAIGDDILKTVTKIFKNTIREEDTLARLGGDEFTVVIENLKQGQDASLLAQKLIQALSVPIKSSDNLLYITTSIGISLYPDDGLTAHDLLKYADSAMYKAKDEGRNNFQFYSTEMTELAFERVIMAAGLREAIKNNEFVVYYQPQVNGLSNKITGMEALVRWNHPTMGLVSPAKFIPIAETTGLIIELDRFVMKTAMTQIVKWYQNGLNPGILAMNLAVKQLQQKDFVSIFEKLIKETGCKSEWLEFEVTEGQIMNNPEQAIKILTKVSDIGIELAVDDFGTGYSSLSYLKKLPLNKLKIDQSFVRGLPDDDEDASIVKAVIALAQSLNLKVIAEGVETEEQKEFLVNNGCTNVQGYLYSRPIPAEEMEIYMQEV